MLCSYRRRLSIYHDQPSWVSRLMNCFPSGNNLAPFLCALGLRFQSRLLRDNPGIMLALQVAITFLTWYSGRFSYFSTLGLSSVHVDLESYYWNIAI